MNEETAPVNEAEEAFWAAIEHAPEDALPKLVFADWLEEQGDLRGQCLRWLVQCDKHPAFDDLDTKTWDWWSRCPTDPTYYQDVSPEQYTLPPNLFTRVPTFGCGLWKGDATLVGALKKVCTAWVTCFEDCADPLDSDALKSEPFDADAVLNSITRTPTDDDFWAKLTYG